MSELIGLPVLDSSQGRVLGDVCDVVFDEQAGILLGVTTDPIMHRGLWLAREDIESVSPLGVVGAASLCQTRGCRWSDRVGKRVEARHGLEQQDGLRGTVADVYVDDGFLEVVGYEIADGLFADWPGKGVVMLDKGSHEDSYYQGKEVTL
ncbi:MAG: PRC-barrel domain-containing protein [Peptococcaceae bacterium]|nr:PRC-barrel domain-containing protein [Peptococcaceae bacterium]